MWTHLDWLFIDCSVNYFIWNIHLLIYLLLFRCYGIFSNSSIIFFIDRWNHIIFRIYDVIKFPLGVQWNDHHSYLKNRKFLHHRSLQTTNRKKLWKNTFTENNGVPYANFKLAICLRNFASDRPNRDLLRYQRV